ncbi:MAG TPA: ribose 5-phosphate isomerase B [Ignavibacteriales bacterium]|nr:ribose 5-phosphate isomerase B [Ignavibacteriales bacterium]
MKKLILESDVIKLFRQGIKVLPVAPNDIVTPLALDKIKSLGITIVRREESEAIEADSTSGAPRVKHNKAAIGSDHTGFRIKGVLSKVLTDKSYGVIDVGTNDETSCDYPDFALGVSLQVLEKKVDFGIIVDATGIPSAITANKIPGIRAATCYNEFSARSAREHNDANVLVVGAKALGEETIKSILEVFMTTSFSGGRHQKRLDKITAVEEKFMKPELKA